MLITEAEVLHGDELLIVVPEAVDKVELIKAEVEVSHGG